MLQCREGHGPRPLGADSGGFGQRYNGSLKNDQESRVHPEQKGEGEPGKRRMTMMGEMTHVSLLREGEPPPAEPSPP